jgi:pimeloyl-ACP methyl ester carboxylesterase
MSIRRRRVTDARIHRRRWVDVALAPVVLCVALASCSIAHVDSGPKVRPPATRDVSDVATTTIVVGGSTTLPIAQPLSYSIAWEAVDDRTDVGTITVPVDYDDPQGATLELTVARHKADPDQRIGVLATNNGGPGSAASTMALNATSWFPPELTDRFDVVSWDPRGTGESGASVDCIDDAEYDRFFAEPDLTPDDAAEVQENIDVAREFAERCVDRVDHLTSIGTNNTARDLDAIRQALGEPQLSYFGFSYGSELGGVWATLFPATVRAAVFDGATDPTADSLERTKDQWVGFESALDTFLAQCSADDDCAFHNDGDAEGAFDALMAQLDASPLPSADGRAPVSRDVAATAVLQSMYSDSYWPALERALEDAAGGDGAGLLQLNDAYYRRGTDGTYTNLMESFQAITCMDQVERPTVEESDAKAADLVGVAPRLFPYTTGSYSCTFFPPSPDPRVEITGIGAGPIVVIGTTGDPSTPLESSRAMADALEDGRLVIVVANKHTGYGTNSCVNDLVEDYLVNLVAPADETTCS